MKKVITFGVFDYFHIGHLALLEQAKKQGDYLIVAVQEDDMILKYKPNTNTYYHNEQRIHLIESIRIVDKVCTYKNVDEDIKKMDFDVFALGEDQNHEGFKQAVSWCIENGKEVVRMHYTKGVSSSQIKGSVQNLV